ncbi:hypothetical protein GCM10009558_025370 [Virgisporangium aurantiacum]
MRATAEHLEPYRRWRMTYRSDGRDLAGFWLAPDADGPHPALVFNHGSIGFGPASLPGLQVLVALGYAVFAPIRRGHNDEPGPYWLDLVPAPWGSPEMGRQLVAALRGELVDVLAAVDWVAARPEVDAGRIVVAGSSFGGVLTVLALSEPAPLWAGISFAGPRCRRSCWPPPRRARRRCFWPRRSTTTACSRPTRSGPSWPGTAVRTKPACIRPSATTP